MTISRKIESLSSHGATLAVDAALEFAENADVKVCVVVVDEAGRFIAGRCMDSVTNASFEVALGKARHSANFRRPSKFQEDLLMEKGVLAVLAVPGMLPLEGGVPIELGGVQIGAIGVSGGPSQIDGEVAKAGVAAIERFA
jgi:glc operon protein GlcG